MGLGGLCERLISAESADWILRPKKSFGLRLRKPARSGEAGGSAVNYKIDAFYRSRSGVVVEVAVKNVVLWVSGS
jgi:hypothetical protein